jgi:hypothetical protein
LRFTSERCNPTARRFFLWPDGDVKPFGKTRAEDHDFDLFLKTLTPPIFWKSSILAGWKLRELLG